MKINKDFIKIFIHQIDNRPNYSFTSSQLCLRSVKWIFFIDQVFEIEPCRWSANLIKPWNGLHSVPHNFIHRLYSVTILASRNKYVWEKIYESQKNWNCKLYLKLYGWEWQKTQDWQKSCHLKAFLKIAVQQIFEIFPKFWKCVITRTNWDGFSWLV